MYGNEFGTIPGRGCCVRRFADALLRSLGGTQVTLRVSDASSGDTASQLGVEAPAAADLQLSPAVVKPLAPEPDGRRRVEVMVSATAVKAIAKEYGIQDVAAWLLGLQGILLHGGIMRIDSVTVDQFAGDECLYHLTATE